MNYCLIKGGQSEIHFVGEDLKLKKSLLGAKNSKKSLSESHKKKLYFDFMFAKYN